MYFKPLNLSKILFGITFLVSLNFFSQTVIHTADFESDLSGWSQAGGDDFDWTRDAGGTPSSNTGPSTGASGSYYMYTESSDPNYPSKVAYFVSPSFDLAGITNPTFVFYYHMYGSGMGTLDVEISTDGGSTYPTNLWSQTGEVQTSSSDDWSQVTLDLTAYIGETIYIRFKGTTGSSYRSDMAIDNVSLTVTYSGPEINVVGNGTNIPDGNTAISASDDTDFGSVYYLNGTITKTFTIENVGTSDLDVSSITSSNALFVVSNITLPVTIASGNSVTFDVTFDPSTVSTQTSTITINNTDSNEDPYTFDVEGSGVDYCASSGTTTYETGVTLVSFNTINNADGPLKDVGYEDFTAISTSVIQGSSYNLTVNVNTDGDYTIYAFVWIDWNQDGDFDDAGETYDMGYATDVSDGATSLSPLSITVPTGATLGSTRMRVSAKYNSDPTSCETGFDGEVEDYTVDVTSPAPAPEIQVLGNANNIPDGDLTTSASNNTNFGDVDTGNSVSKIFTIENIGDADLTIGTTVTLATGTIFTVTIQPATTTITSGNFTTFTITFSPVTVGAFTDVVTISNNDSDEDPFTFTIAGNGLAPLAAGPGGVTNGLYLWLKSTSGLGYTNGQSVSLWSDQARGADATVNTAGQEPTYRDDAAYNVNFNPVVDFDNSYNPVAIDSDFSYDDTTTQFLEGTSGLYTQDMFVVLIPDTTVNSTFGSMDVFCGDEDISSNQTDATGIGFGAYSIRFDSEVISYAIGTTSEDGSGGTENGYGVAETGGASYDNVGIINARNNTGLTQQELYYNATNIETTQNDVADFSNVNDSRYWIGRSEGWEASTDARIVEIITYSSRKTDASLTDERNKIQSYLAIKYGITLGVNGTTQDYVDSAGNVIWDQSANAGYNYDIAGIGRDDDSALNQKQSKSVNSAFDGTGQIRGLVTMGLTDIYTTNNQNISNNPTTFNDKEFLTWGNNNGNLDNAPNVINVDMSAGISGLSTPVTFTGMERVWKVTEHGGDIPSVKISIPTSAVRNISPPGSYFMFISDTGVFSPTADYRIMTEVGSNLETEYDFDGIKYITFGYAPETRVVRSINFDGIQDYIDMEDALDVNPSQFTISAWVKRGAGSTNTSIVSKRDNPFTEGYDFKINSSNQFEVVWKNGSTHTITSTTVIPQDEWHHVAIIYSGGTANLYIDGVLDTSVSSLTDPVNTSQSFYIAAAGKNTPTAFFEGNIDEVRIWDVALSVNQLRYIMNQEIEDNASFINGTIIPQTITKNEVASIPWANLAGYYPMSAYAYTNTIDDSGNKNQGALRNLDTVDYQTAPLPYESTANGSWDTAATWLNNSVQTLPNENSIVDGSKITWNIVETNNNVNIIRDVTVLGLKNNANELSVNADNSLTVSHYLLIDGVIDLDGESQLIQTTGSDLDAASTGYLERDQQGVGNLYRYNDWSSPVVSDFVAKTYTVADVLKDGTNASNPVNISFVGGYNGAVGPPIQIAEYWIYKYVNDLFDDYSKWVQIGSTGTLKAGEGFLMKGTGSAADQNYVFVGKPNNGTITLTVNDNNDYLVGNPYPSALDANQFIADNAGSITGTLYFWEHYGGNTHNLKDYQAGYGAYNLSGGVATTADPDVNQTAPTSPKTPARYVAVGQGFFVQGNATSGAKSIVFNNGQRAFQTEDVTNSIFMKTAKSTKTASKITADSDMRQKFRIGFNVGGNGHRQLLLTIDDRATDGVDWGFDGEIYDLLSNDMYWTIDSKKYVIQATNKLSLDKEIPLGIQLKEDGVVNINVDEFVNVTENTSIYIKDNFTGETYNITNQPFEINLKAGEYEDRFVLTFQPRLKTLEEIALEEGIHIFMNNAISEIQIKKIVDTEILNISIFNYLGQEIQTWKTNLNERFISLPINNATSGMYIVQINTTTGQITKKIIVQK
ncbi:hypothetical protein Lupro_08715 [Lutibacter profundi]|uniref:MAM domain-containing protein n=1 Tax=Lutibacter profundi TaxID=1622118 RepID=A0A0X8G7Y1_9FLAO|nr:choice-of-anchor D domain-containing protein [Lutibacter profundi]AMC11333.1 hypothetical protein Lupro_08715 [Lutibacter profundi]